MAQELHIELFKNPQGDILFEDCYVKSNLVFDRHEELNPEGLVEAGLEDGTKVAIHSPTPDICCMCGVVRIAYKPTEIEDIVIHSKRHYFYCGELDFEISFVDLLNKGFSISLVDEN